MFAFTYTITIHGPDIFYDITLQRLREKIENAHFICCISYYTRSQLMRIVTPNQWSKFEITPMGINPSIFTPNHFREHPSPFQILCVGRLVPAKGHDILLASLKILISGGRDLHLKLVGDGPDRTSLEKSVSEKGLGQDVTFLGSLNQDQTLEAFQGADIFALASSAEGIPVVLMEAMSMEIPCIASNITGIPELIRHEIDGILVSPSDETGLANAIAYLIDNPQARKKIGKAGRQRVLEKYNLESNVKNLAKIFTHRLRLSKNQES